MRYNKTSDEALQGLAGDFATEDRKLARAIEKGRLEIWWQGIIDAAKAKLYATEDDEGEKTAREEASKRDIERGVGRWTPNGEVTVNGINGHYDADTSNVGSSVDSEGDMLMD